MVTGKKGTLKRKTQIQELIQQSEMGYSDDLLDLTPFREKTLRVPVSSTGRANGGLFLRRLTVLDSAESLQDLAGLPSNRLEALSGGRVGQYSIRINRQWRICFCWSSDGPYDVEIVDYHR